MHFVMSQRLKRLSEREFQTIQELSHIAKNLTNEAIYNVRQYYFTEGEFLKYEKNYTLLKESPNYKLLNSNMAQRILKDVDACFKSFFGLLKLAKQGKYSFRDCCLPDYLPEDGFATLVIGFVRIKGDTLVLPFSNLFKKTHDTVSIKLPPVLIDKKIKEIRIIPRNDAAFFDIQYAYDVPDGEKNLDECNVLTLDFGLNNLVTAVSSCGDSFILDGRRLKSINQWFNKENARLQRIKDKQGYGVKRTKRQRMLIIKRNHRVNDYMNKVARYVINYCLEHDVGTLVVGYNETIYPNVNSDFLNIPYGKLRLKLERLCDFYGIRFVKQEESYTSKASFFDDDIIPVYNADNPKHYVFSGKRVHRGLYETADGNCINADVNGALNILRKSKIAYGQALRDIDNVCTPMRVMIT